MARIDEAARAKINLTLHVTGWRSDGYHLLDSLVVFAGVADRISVSESRATSLAVTGPRADGVPRDGSNLVLRAAALMPKGAAITLEKRLPAAAGIGGGSADAAATLRALARLHGTPLPEPNRVLALGADVPVCLAGRAIRMRGIGERLSDVPPLPPLPAVLVNPGIEIPTPEVFRRLACRDNPPMPEIPEDATAETLVDWLAKQRNDLEPPARAIAPEVGDAIEALAARSLLARMSGSGATCFGLFGTSADARAAAAELASAHPNWWVVPTTLT